MNYKVRDGVHLVKICDAFLLIPDYSASDFCKGIQSLNFIELIVWKQIEKGKTREEIIGIISALFFQDKNIAENKLIEIIKKLSDRNYLEKEDC